MKTFIDTYADAEAVFAVDRLRELATFSRRHELVGRPEEADLILISGFGNLARRRDYLRQVVRKDLISRFPKKAFVLSYRDEPIIFTRGIYESAVKGPLAVGRVCGGTFRLAGDLNPAIFSYGRDVELPNERRYLMSFIGRCSHRCRRELFNLKFARSDILVKDS